MVIKITIFFLIINSNKQQLKSIISIVSDIYFIIKAWQRNFVNFVGSYFMIFTLDSIHQMFENFIVQQNIFVFTMTYCCNNILVLTVFFLCSQLSSTKKESICSFNSTNSETPPVSSFILPTINLFESS